MALYASPPMVTDQALVGLNEAWYDASILVGTEPHHTGLLSLFFPLGLFIIAVPVTEKAK